MVILLKNTSSLFILARYDKNEVLIGTIWNVINLYNIFILINQINIALHISYVKLAYPAIFLLIWIEISGYYNVFNWLKPFINQFETLELISNASNSMLL